ncbi:MAG: hypothetical protein SWY16_01360 [Cyanobacteriota bacterium]|nr:hypothetical protein [Cyanobacteriota bacterium]
MTRGRGDMGDERDEVDSWYLTFSTPRSPFPVPRSLFPIPR